MLRMGRDEVLGSLYDIIRLISGQCVGVCYILRIPKGTWTNVDHEKLAVL